VPEPETTTILDWVIELVESSYAAFQDDPRGVIESSDLTERQKKVLLDGDPLRIRHVMDYESNLDWKTIMIHVNARPPGDP
jgi:hypothetical protein